jgi:hypothetical protein
MKIQFLDFLISLSFTVVDCWMRAAEKNKMVMVMVFNTTFNNISAILWRSVYNINGGGKRSNRRKPKI